MKKPCRFKKCKGVIHRGSCPVRVALGRKGGNVKTATLSPAQLKQRKQASKQARTPSASRNKLNSERMKAKQAASKKAGLCLYCHTAHEGICPLASRGGHNSITVRTIKEARKTIKRRTALKNRKEMERRAAIQFRPLLTLDAIPSSWVFVCIRCNASQKTGTMSVAFADDVGFGLCKTCDNQIVENISFGIDSRIDG